MRGKELFKVHTNKFRHSIRFLENVIQDGMKLGLAEESWQHKIVTYADIQSVCDSKFVTLENFNFGHVMTEALVLFKMRFISGISTKMRIAFLDRQFEIKRIINVEEQNRLLKIIALEIL